MQLYKDTTNSIGLEKPEADFIDEELLDQPETVYRVDDRGRRFYYTLNKNNEPTFYGSVTSIKSQTSPTPRAFIEKELRLGSKEYQSYVENRQQLGTLFHILVSEATIQGYFDFDSLQDRINRYAIGSDQKDIQSLVKKVKGSDTDFQSSQAVIDIIKKSMDRKVEYTEGRYGKPGWYYELSRGLMAWLQFMRDYEVTPIAVELSLAHPDGFANTIDLYCERNKNNYSEKTAKKNRKRIRSILDWKTGGIFPGYEVQLAFNKRSFEYHYPNQPVDVVENWTYKENSRSTPYYKYDQTGRCSPDQLDSILNIWKQKGKTEPGNIERIDGEVTAEQASMDLYNTQSVADLIKQKHDQLDEQ